jgi:hypothetical protein
MSVSIKPYSMRFSRITRPYAKCYLTLRTLYEVGSSRLALRTSRRGAVDNSFGCANSTVNCEEVGFVNHAPEALSIPLWCFALDLVPDGCL